MKVLPLWLSIAGVAGCGGDDPATLSLPAPLALRVTFEQPQTYTALASGSVGFTVEPALPELGTVICTIDGDPTLACLVDVASGEVRFTDLGPGLHDLRLAARSGDGTIGLPSLHVVEVAEIEVLVYGATPGGIAAAVAAARSGRVVAIVEASNWVGGMMSGGLAFSDMGWRGREIIGGLANEFFVRVRGAEAARGVCLDPQCFDRYEFEPHVAERIFEEMLVEHRIVVERGALLESVQKEGALLRSVTTSRGRVPAEVFIDASYEGDLMALAGVPFRLGREPRALAVPPDDPSQLAEQEDSAGAQRFARPLGGLFVDPYRVPGDPSSGPIAFVEPRPATLPVVGEGDARVMAYTYRLCVTDDPSNGVPFERPEGYDPARYEASGRVAQAWAQAGANLAERMFNPARTTLSPNDPRYWKHDLNGGTTFSIDMTAPDMNQRYVEANEVEREQIRNAYRDYIRGLLYFWQTDPRFGALNEKIARFGWCADEFADRGGWPHQLYVRQSRRMLGEYTMNENDVMQNGRRPPIEDGIGFAAYNVDVHAVRYFAAPFTWPDGIVRDAVVNEGFLTRRQPDDAPYPVSYRALTPRVSDATNLLNPVTLSSTHVAYGSLRMEPTFMILGEAAGVAAAIAIESGSNVQAVSYPVLRERLIRAGQRL